MKLTPGVKGNIVMNQKYCVEPVFFSVRYDKYQQLFSILSFAFCHAIE